ncbi:MAG: molybdenum cofactor biosynthesis protein MoaE, partial [Acidobacteriota bacterium]
MIELTREPIDLQRVLDAVRSPRAGAVVTFDGRVRNH